ncbi:hypothetical protein Emag_001465 [Eimeria magna]
MGLAFRGCDLAMNCFRIGNWLESRHRRDELRAAFKERRAAGNLSYKKKELRVATALRPQQATQFCCKGKLEELETAALTATTAARAAEASEETLGGPSASYLMSGNILGLYTSASRRLLAALPLDACMPGHISAAAAAAGAAAAAVAAQPTSSVWRNTFIIEASAKNPKATFLSKP